MESTLTNIQKTFLAIIIGILMITSFGFNPVVHREDAGDINDVSISITDGKLSLSGGGLTNTSSSEAMSGLINKYKVIIVCFSGFGAVTMIAFFIMNFLKLGSTATNPSERAKVLAGLVWTGIAAAGLGSVSLLVGFFYYAMR